MNRFTEEYEELQVWILKPWSQPIKVQNGKSKCNGKVNKMVRAVNEITRKNPGKNSFQIFKETKRLRGQQRTAWELMHGKQLTL